MIKKISVLLLSLLICITPLLAYATTSDGNFALLDKNGITVPDTLTYLDERNGWISNGQNLIENFYSCTSPETVYVPEWDVEGGYPYRMFFYGWAFTEGNNPAPQYDYEGYPGGDAIFCARAESIYGPWQVWSMDPSTKEGYWDENMQPYFWCPVFTCSTDPSAWYDNHHIADATVVWADGRFHLMASSQGSDVDGKFGDFDAADTDGYSGCAVGAVSSDGISWTKAEGPLLVWENEKGFDENAVGGWYTGKGYYGALGQPSLLYDDGVWKCWFTYNASVMSARWGYAENHGDFLDPDDWQFIKYYDDPTNILGSTDFDVIKIGDKYHAFANTWINYYGLTYDYLDNYPLADWRNMGSTCLTHFISSDGIDWAPVGYFYPDDGTPANNCSQVMYDPKTNNICLFYAVMRGQGEHPWFDWRWYAIRVRTRSLELFSEDYTFYEKPAPKPAEWWEIKTDRQYKDSASGGAIDAFGRILPFENDTVKIYKITDLDLFENDTPIVTGGKNVNGKVTLLGQENPEEIHITDGRVVISSALGKNRNGIARFAINLTDPLMSSAQSQAKLCDGVGIYVENNTDSEIVLNSFNGSSSSHILSKNDGVGYFITLEGKCTAHTLASSPSGDHPQGIAIPAGAKGYAIFFVDDLSLSSTGSYDPSKAPIIRAGVRLNNAKVDPDKNQSIVLDDPFFFGISNQSSPSGISISGPLTLEDPQASATPSVTDTPTIPSGSPEQTDGTVIIIITAVVIILTIAVIIIFKNKSKAK